MAEYGIYHKHKKDFVYGIHEPTPDGALRKLHRKGKVLGNYLIVKELVWFGIYSEEQGDFVFDIKERSKIKAYERLKEKIGLDALDHKYIAQVLE
jgi:hypothetical protein